MARHTHKHSVRSRACLAAVVFAFCLATSQGAEREDVLRLFMGEWDVRVQTILPKRSEITYRETFRWALDRRFIQGETSKRPDGVQQYLGTYDPMSDTYPFWFFSAKGWACLWLQGKWNAQTRTLLWKSLPVSDVRVELQMEFPDDRTRRWTLLLGNVFGTQSKQEGVAVRVGESPEAALGSAVPAPEVLPNPTPSEAAIRELTPQLVGALLWLANLAVPVLALLLSAGLLWWYRRAVLRLMEATISFEAVAPRAPESDSAETVETLYRRAMRGPWLEAGRYLAAGLVMAVIFAWAARFVYPIRLDLAGFVIAVVIYAWPIVPTLLLVLPARWPMWVGLVGGYFFILFALTIWAGGPDPAAGAATGLLAGYPLFIVMVWRQVNTIPTLALILCFNRWARPVAPLVLGFVALAICGIFAVFVGLFLSRALEGAQRVAKSIGLHPGWLLLGTTLLSLAVFCAVAWLLARWIAQSYRRGQISDQSLAMDAVWLLFISTYSMWLLFGGLQWAAMAPVGFALYKQILALGRTLNVRPVSAPRNLTFLRVFGLGRRSTRLLTRLAKHWRHLGSVQMITGPDTARYVVHPRQFLDFLSGRLTSHFVRDPSSLERSVADWNRPADADGRFAMGNYFCHADTWQHLLPKLLEKDDVVLMDLRSFTRENAGCVHEIRYLVEMVPSDHWLIIVDRTTDRDFLHEILREAWQTLPGDSPNARVRVDEVPVQDYEPTSKSLRQLIHRLCQCAASTAQ